MIALWAAAWLSGATATMPPPKPLMVTTDTEGYCDHLATLAARHHHAAAEARLLAHEGAEMCDHGAIRAGIARLRRALMMMRDEHPRPP